MEFKEVIAPMGEPVLLDGVPVHMIAIAAREGLCGPDLCVRFKVPECCDVQVAPMDAETNDRWQEHAYVSLEDYFRSKLPVEPGLAPMSLSVSRWRKWLRSMWRWERLHHEAD
ncbi:hypothetical protein [Planctomicrobium piriforme]|uniref:Uncharacterized protein n=1 Tax=Planctomicrobium piriforme TaxID=1576369 RepID=A0A1I3PYQ9_9PLAN|nr:hypothetical protein [Planctomicrobium piriforme]SFJ27004.1 hypothetical protein SAMN05421753_11791 [Planctomicrobium piriforme]